MSRKICVLLLLACPLYGADTSPVTPARTAPIDKKVQDVLSSAIPFYASLQSFEVDIISTTEVETAGIKNEMGSSYHVALLRPNSFALTLKAGIMGGSLISDGKTVATYQPMLNKYTSTSAPEQLSDLLQPMNLALVTGGQPMGFESFLTNDPLKALEVGVTQNEYIGLEKIGDVPVHHFRLHSKASIVDLWIADSPQPFLLQSQTTPDLKDSMKGLSAEQKKKMPAGFENMKMERTNIFSNWQINKPISPATFQFQPPLGAKLVSEFFVQPPHPLVGKPAPDFTLNDIDGKAVHLSSLRGKVVVLDFWATWCGPCVATLPIVSEVTSSFKDRGVVFYAVNLREDAVKIGAFQKDKGLVFPVLLDGEGKVADIYQAKGIPQSVLIDKNGKIVAIHVGYHIDLKKVLTQQISDVLAGK